MTIETSFALIAAVAAGIWKLGKEAPEIKRGSRKALQEESQFADSFFAKSAAGTMHPFAYERGLQALAGTRTIKGSEIEFILNLSDEVSLLNDFVNGRRHLCRDKDSPDSKFKFTAMLHSRTRREIAKKFWYCTYMISFCGAMGSLLLTISGSIRLGIAETILIGTTLLPLAVISALSAIGIGCAERVLVAQEAVFDRLRQSIDGEKNSTTTSLGALCQPSPSELPELSRNC